MLTGEIEVGTTSNWTGPRASRRQAVSWPRERDAARPGHVRNVVLCCLSAALLWDSTAYGQAVGDRVRLQSASVSGVPVHPAVGDASYVRWQNGTLGTIRAFDSSSGWFEIGADDAKTGWVTKRYLTVIGAETEDEQPENELASYVVGTWNIEHFRDGATRGFPENGNGGPSYAPRTDDDLRQIADLIVSQMDAKVLILNEINGREDGTSGELDRLIGHLGSSWKYTIARSGERQRVAMIFDERFVRRTACHEFEVSPTQVDGKDIFDRDPLACHFQLLDGQGAPRNDFLVVGLHLASGQHHAANHNRAMRVLKDRLRQSLSDGTFPSGERDVLIGGDLNASRYDTKTEDFWEGYDSGGLKFVTLSPSDGTEYPGTRLAGVPLVPKSQIDYLLASGINGGLTQELVQLLAEVRLSLTGGDFDDFRRRASDHLPVTVRIRVVPDDDP